MHNLLRKFISVSITFDGNSFETIYLEKVWSGKTDRVLEDEWERV